MIKIINSWAQGIIIVVIIATIIEIVLPEGNNKKYVKVVLSIYILFSIIYPIVNVYSNGNINFNTILRNTNKEIEKHNERNITIETNSYIENTYKNNLKQDIESKLKEKGYIVKDLKLYIETENEEKFGRINSIVLDVDSYNKETSEITNKIEEVNIILSNTNISMQKEQISEEEINKLKEYFVNSYSIEKERIHINE